MTPNPSTEIRSIMSVCLSVWYGEMRKVSKYQNRDKTKRKSLMHMFALMFGISNLSCADSGDSGWTVSEYTTARVRIFRSLDFYFYKSSLTVFYKSSLTVFFKSSLTSSMFFPFVLFLDVYNRPGGNPRCPFKLQK